MTVSIYSGPWSDSHDVCSAFGVSPDTLKKARVFVACYDQEEYGGMAYVLFARKGVLYEVHGSHCSCHGLEDQWSPEDTTLQSIEFRLKEGNLSKYMDGQEKRVVAAIRRYLKTL